MRLSNLSIGLLVMALVAGCGSGNGTNGTSGASSTGGSSSSSGSGSGSSSGGSSGSGSTDTGSGSTASNVLAVTVNGSLCSSSTSSGYTNKPCVSVTVCTPGTSTCQTIDDILLDTGSYGLRIFSSALTGVTLTQVSSPSGGALTECVEFGDGSSLWGPVMTASVILGNEDPVEMPIQVINAGFGTLQCGTPRNPPYATPTDAGFTGILGVGLFAQDCGTDCSDHTNNGMYYSVSGTITGATAAPLASQVINPVAALTTDKNGVLVQLPTVATAGAASATGSLILGIGTRTNNTPSSATAYPANPSIATPDFQTTYGGTSYSGFLDTGSNSLFFPATSSLPACSNSSYSDWFCPSTTESLSAVNAGYAGSPSGTVSFQVGDAVAMFNSSYSVFPALGGTMTGEFDWGLPFFMGRSVYVGLDGTTSTLGTGPYWAY